MRHTSNSFFETRNRAPVRRLVLRLCFGLLIWAFCLSAFAQEEAAGRTVFLAGSGNGALDQHLTGLLQSQMGEGVNLRPITDDQIPMIGEEPVITIGPSAFSRIRQANRNVPILAMLVDRSFLDAFADRSPGRVSGILYDVPLIRQALTGKAILPHATRIALLATADSVELYEPLIDKLPAYGMSARIFLVESSDKLIPTLVRALGYGDFLLAAPDTQAERAVVARLRSLDRVAQLLLGPRAPRVDVLRVHGELFPVYGEEAVTHQEPRARRRGQADPSGGG